MIKMPFTSNSNLNKKEIKRIYSELDPYGEEIWDDVEIQQSSNSNLLPICQRISARTIGIDLVSVKPMSNNTSKIWFDFEYSYFKDNESKGNQIFNELDPYGEEKWDD